MSNRLTSARAVIAAVCDCHRARCADTAAAILHHSGAFAMTALLERASSSCGLVPSIGNQCASAISEREPDQQANCEYNCC